ncbi:hypothetical protein BD309DRAFT_762078 [Dichomitus squalens]|nr:hypothetical protein BD309DRAFT_762078 [Dichomitus squalens]
MDRYEGVVRDEFRMHRDAVLSGRDAVHSLDDFIPLWDFSRIISQAIRTMNDTLYSFRDRQHMSDAFKHAYEMRMQDYRTRLSRYPTGSVVDASLAIIAPLNLDSHADQEIMKSIAFYQLGERSLWLRLKGSTDTPWLNNRRPSELLEHIPSSTDRESPATWH